MITSLIPAYIPLIQKPHTCAAACMQMILYRNGLGLHNQEDIAICFGIKISPESSMAFTSEMPVAQEGQVLGLSTINSAAPIQRTLTSFGANLKIDSVFSSQITNLDDFLVTNIKANRDLWVEYDASKIHANDQRGGEYIHDGLVESFDTETSTVTLIDSMPDHRQRITLPISELADAISPKDSAETGFIVIST